MATMRAIGLAGWSGSGKTTLITSDVCLANAAFVLAVMAAQKAAGGVVCR